MKLLIVEDNDTDLDTCRDCVKDFIGEKKCQIDLIECITLDEAIKIIDKTFDGAIIDIKLGVHGDEGNKVLDKIRETSLRIPVAILTATPGNVEQKPNYIGVYKKGEEGAGYADLLYTFWEIYNTGLTRIMGGRGRIEESLGRIFNESLMLTLYRKKWIEYGKKDTLRTERALLRHTLSHLFQLLDDDDDSYFPEEVYLTPPLISGIKTGSIVIEKESGEMYVIMTPACDLLIRDENKRNTDTILAVKIDTMTTMFARYTSLKEKENAFKNKLTLYYHCLPKTDFFEGGFMNFRKMTSSGINEFENRFEKPIVQISPPFLKDIISRFSGYYARQGQPEIEI